MISTLGCILSGTHAFVQTTRSFLPGIHDGASRVSPIAVPLVDNRGGGRLASLIMRKRVVAHGIFGLGVPEVLVIIGVAAFLLGPQKLADMARQAGSQVGEMQDVPKGFNEGFAEGASSEETKKLVRDLGKATVVLKDTATDMAGEYASVAKEFSAGLQDTSKEINKELVGGLKEANALVGDARSTVKNLSPPKKGEEPKV